MRGSVKLRALTGGFLEEHIFTLLCCSVPVLELSCNPRIDHHIELLFFPTSH